MADPIKPQSQDPPFAAPRSEGSDAGRRLQLFRARMERRLASAMNSALGASGVGVTVDGPQSPPLLTTPPPIQKPVGPAPRPPLRGPTPVEVMSAVQGAVVGAVKVVSGAMAGVEAARDAASAIGKSGDGAAKVARGLVTVASGFFPQLAGLGKSPQPPQNRAGRPPQRRVVVPAAKASGRIPFSGPTPAAGSGPAAAAVTPPASPPIPTQRVQRIPMVRARSSLDLSRNQKTRKRRSYDDLALRMQIGLTPHEILLKVATLALGKTLLGVLEAGARGQQKALQRASERISQKQIMLLGMLPAQYIVQRLPPQPALSSTPSAAPTPEPAERASTLKPGGPFKIRY